MGRGYKGVHCANGGDPLDEAEVISYVRTQIAGYKCPKTVEHVNELPEIHQVKF